MDILTDIYGALSALGIPAETGVFAGVAPDVYLVTVPLSDRFGLHADNLPGVTVQEARITLFSKGSYLADRDRVTDALLDAGFIITDRRYIGFETDTGYHHYAVDAAKYYGWRNA